MLSAKTAGTWHKAQPDSALRGSRFSELPYMHDGMR